MPLYQPIDIPSANPLRWTARAHCEKIVDNNPMQSTGQASAASEGQYFLAVGAG